MVIDPFFADLTTIVTPIILIGGFIFGAIKYLNTQSNKKSEQIKQLIEDTIANTNKKLDISNEKAHEILDDLKKRADITNGNVFNIRSDILDLQEEIEELQHNDEITPRTKARAKKKRARRTQIELDRKNQH